MIFSKEGLVTDFRDQIKVSATWILKLSGSRKTGEVTKKSPFSSLKQVISYTMKKVT